MRPDDPIPRDAFIQLVDRSAPQLEQDTQRGNFWYHDQALRGPTKHGPPRGRRPARRFIAYDAVVLTLSDMLVAQGPRRQAVSLAYPGMYIAVREIVDHPRGVIALAIGQPGHLAAYYGTDPSAIMREISNDPSFVGVWLCPIAPAIAQVGERATAHGIQLPETFAPATLPRWAASFPNAVITGGPGVTVRWTAAVGRPPILADLRALAPVQAPSPLGQHA